LDKGLKKIQGDLPREIQRLESLLAETERGLREELAELETRRKRGEQGLQAKIDEVNRKLPQMETNRQAIADLRSDLGKLAQLTPEDLKGIRQELARLADAQQKLAAKQRAFDDLKQQQDTNTGKIRDIEAQLAEKTPASQRELEGLNRRLSALETEQRRQGEAIENLGPRVANPRGALFSTKSLGSPRARTSTALASPIR